MPVLVFIIKTLIKTFVLDKLFLS